MSEVKVKPRTVHNPALLRILNDQSREHLLLYYLCQLWIDSHVDASIGLHAKNFIRVVKHIHHADRDLNYRLKGLVLLDFIAIIKYKDHASRLSRLQTLTNNLRRFHVHNLRPSFWGDVLRTLRMINDLTARQITKDHLFLQGLDELIKMVEAAQRNSFNVTP